jgi:hypothetical protein
MPKEWPTSDRSRPATERTQNGSAISVVHLRLHLLAEEVLHLPAHNKGNALRGNRDIPRPFVFKPPLPTQTRYPAGEALVMRLEVVGRR